MLHFVIYVKDDRELDRYQKLLKALGRTCCVEIGDENFFDLPALRTDSDIFFGRRSVDYFLCHLACSQDPAKAM